MFLRLSGSDETTGGGGKRGNLPHLFQGEHVGGSAICHVVTLGDEQTRGSYWLRRLRNIELRNAPTPRSQCERMRIKVLVGEVSLLIRAPRIAALLTITSVKV